jgi:hypothetical protein
MVFLLQTGREGKSLEVRRKIVRRENILNKGMYQTVKMELQISHLTDWVLVHVRYRPKHRLRHSSSG